MEELLVSETPPLPGTTLVEAFNAAIDSLQDNIAGTTTKSVAGSGTTTLTAAECYKNRLVFTGILTGNSTVTVPDTEAFPGWEVLNSTTGAYTLTLKTVSGSGVLVPQGAAIQAHSDGVDVMSPQPLLHSGESSLSDGDTVAELPVIQSDADNPGISAIIRAVADGTAGKLLWDFLVGLPGSLTRVLRIKDTGVEVTGGLSISKTALTSPVAADGNTYSGYWTPALTNSTNAAASTAFECNFARVGDEFVLGGTVAIDPTSASTATVVYMSLPFTSNFVANTDAGGTGVAYAGQEGSVLAIYADSSTPSRLVLRWYPGGTSNTTFKFTVAGKVVA